MRIFNIGIDRKLYHGFGSQNFIRIPALGALALDLALLVVVALDPVLAIEVDAAALDLLVVAQNLVKDAPILPTKSANKEEIRSVCKCFLSDNNRVPHNTRLIKIIKFVEIFSIFCLKGMQRLKGEAKRVHSTGMMVLSDKVVEKKDFFFFFLKKKKWTTSKATRALIEEEVKTREHVPVQRKRQTTDGKKKKKSFFFLSFLFFCL